MQESTAKKPREFKTTRQFTQLRKMIETITDFENQQLQKAKLYDKIVEILGCAESTAEKVKRIEQVITIQQAA